MGVGVDGVGVVVGVIVDVEVGVAVGSTTRPVSLRVKKTNAAPIPKNIASNANAIGRLKVTWGMRLPCTALSLRAGFSIPLKSLPHTRQRAASSLTRVPQVGHNFVGFDGVSDVIGTILPRVAWQRGLYQPFISLVQVFSFGE